MRFSYGRVAFFKDFGHCKMRCCFGCVLGGSEGTVFGAFWAILAGFWGFERRPILKAKLEAEKVVPGPRGGVDRRVRRP